MNFAAPTVSHYFPDEVPLHLTGLNSTGGEWTDILDYSPPKLSPKNVQFTVNLREIKQMTHFMFSTFWEEKPILEH